MEPNAKETQVEQSDIQRSKAVTLYPAELLSYSTVRLVCERPNESSYGTGFFYAIPVGTGAAHHSPVIVSNRHVAEGALKTHFALVSATSISASHTKSYQVVIDHTQIPWIAHPDPSVDLSILPIAPQLEHMREQGQVPFFYPLTPSLIPDDEYLESVTQTDEVIMIGYPGALWDDVNNQPIFRKGTLATSPAKDFCGQHQFLIDMPVFRGSSGSPVLLFSDGMYFDRNQGACIMGNRLKLLGINAATYQSTVTGKVVPVPVPTVIEAKQNHTSAVNSDTNRVAQKISLETQTKIPNNLGIIIRASRLKEFYEHISNLQGKSIEARNVSE